MKLKCKIFGHKLGWEIFDPRPCQRTGCDHVEPARERPPCPPMPKNQNYIPEAIVNLKFTDKPTLSEWCALGVQCGKTEYMENWIKWLIYEKVREHQHRHMWE